MMMLTSTVMPLSMIVMVIEDRFRIRMKLSRRLIMIVIVMF